MKKVAEIQLDGFKVICIRDDSKVNPFRVYRVWCDGGKHRKLLVKYGDMTSVLWYLYNEFGR